MYPSLQCLLITIGRYCPYYDTESKEIQLNYEQPCNEHSNPCPDFYLSNMVHKCKHKDVFSIKVLNISFDCKQLFYDLFRTLLDNDNDC